MAKQEPIKTKGIILEAFANAMFRVQLDNGHNVTAHVSGKIRLNFINISVGDKVELEMSPYDMQRARITKRL
jgi:translation initiation factor IF-1